MIVLIVAVVVTDKGVQMIVTAPQA
jgi:hypothetical protein